MPGNRDPFAAFICDDNALDTLRPVVAELGWAPEKCAKGGLRILHSNACDNDNANEVVLYDGFEGAPLGQWQCYCMSGAPCNRTQSSTFINRNCW